VTTTQVRTATYARIQYHIDPTLPPGQRSVPGEPDPRTATCEQHKVASPYSDTAKGDGVAVPKSNGWPCVVCPHPDADLIGTEVISSGNEGIHVYGGEDPDRPGWQTVSYSLGSGGPRVLKCAVESVAPAGTPIEEKDPRISVQKLAKKRDYQDSGVWLPRIDHPDFRYWQPRARKSKREAIAGAARRLAIAEYHQARNAG